MSTEAALLRAWTRRGPLAWALWPLSLLYGLLVRLRRAAYTLGLLRADHVPVPVVVVGNVLAGGVGKTPIVMALVRHLQHRGLQVGVVSRGHGRQVAAGAPDGREVQDDSPAAEVGDEPLLIHRQTGAPVFVARRRAEAARALLARHPQTQVIVCDDGLQHLALAQDLTLCVFDDRGTGNGFLLPAGPLREPWPRAVDFVLHTGQPSPTDPLGSSHTVRRVLASGAVDASGHRVPLASLRGRPLTALAGIGRPEAFFDMLRAQGLTLAETLALPDHHAFDSPPSLQHRDLPLLCTEKDAVKLWRHAPQALAVPLQVELPPSFLQAFDQRLDARLSSRHGHQTP